MTILANATTATIDVSVLDENLLEDSETVTLTLTGITSGNAGIRLGTTVRDTVTIADDDTAVVTIAANDGNAAEPADHGQFTVTLTNPSDTDTVVSYTVSGDATPGSDYTRTYRHGHDPGQFNHGHDRRKCTRRQPSGR